MCAYARECGQSGSEMGPPFLPFSYWGDCSLLLVAAASEAQLLPGTEAVLLRWC